MNERTPDCRLSDEDLREALKEMKSYIDITEEDLRRIYAIALRHARARVSVHLPVRELMNTKVVTVNRDTDIDQAARLLSENAISGMPVIDERNVVIGVISEADILLSAGLHEGHRFRDILRRVLGEPVPTGKAGDRVENVMSFPPITAKADDAVADVARILDNRRIKRLPVVTDDGKLIGIISRADIVHAIGKK